MERKTETVAYRHRECDPELCEVAEAIADERRQAQEFKGFWDRAESERDRAIRQRDDLLAACDTVANTLEALEANTDGSGSILRGLAPILRAAIARATDSERGQS